MRSPDFQMLATLSNLSNMPCEPNKTHMPASVSLRVSTLGPEASGHPFSSESPSFSELRNLLKTPQSSFSLPIASKAFFALHLSCRDSLLPALGVYARDFIWEEGLCKYD